jgi:hypothetical protein
MITKWSTPRGRTSPIQLAVRLLDTFLLATFIFLTFAEPCLARRTTDPPSLSESPRSTSADIGKTGVDRPFRASTASDTTVLGSWNFNQSCQAGGWTSVDRTTSQTAFFHVDDFSGLGGGSFSRLVAIQGSKSLWCGARPSGNPALCNYDQLPGYGNNWEQVFRTSNCLSVTGVVTMKFRATWDVEESYDYVVDEYDVCDGQWLRMEGTHAQLSGFGRASVIATIPAAAHTGHVRVRIRVHSDSAWSDEDGLWNTDGAVVMDSLRVQERVRCGPPDGTL